MVLNLELYDIIRSQKGADIKEFKKNDCIYHEGEIPEGIHCIDSGKIKILKSEINVKNRIVQLASKGEILGIHAIVNNHPYTSTAVVMDKTKTIFLSSDNFIKLVESDNSYKFLVMKSLCSSIDTMESHISMISDKQSEQRCAQTLLMLINKYGLKNKKILKIKLSLDELASYMCMSRGYMKKIMIDFSTNGILNFESGEITILDKKQLEIIAQKAN